MMMSVKLNGQPLHLAALIERPNVIRELLAAGASPMAKDNKGQTPIDIAREHGRTEAVKLLTVDDRVCGVGIGLRTLPE